MKFFLLALLCVTCSCLKISPFVPEEMTRQELEIAKTHLKLEKREISAEELGRVDSDQSQSTTTEQVYTDDTDDTVPIVVGCLLAALIAVVMVSYFVIRARANRK